MLQFSKEKRRFLNRSICCLYVLMYFTVMTAFYEQHQNQDTEKQGCFQPIKDFGGQSHFMVSYIGELAWGLSGKESACQCRRHGFDSWSRNIPWRKKWQPTLVFLTGNPLSRGAWCDIVHGVSKELDTTQRLYITTTTVEILLPDYNQKTRRSLSIYNLLYFSLKGTY